MFNELVFNLLLILVEYKVRLENRIEKKNFNLFIGFLGKYSGSYLYFIKEFIVL